jgi:4,5-dihydroxyphthalate decarboxylase
MGTYLVARALDREDLQAIPFFTRRMFCHRFCFVRAGAGIARPADLAGRRIGVLTYQNSLAIFVKGLLRDHGLALEDVTWVTMGAERVATPLPPGIRLERAPAGRTMEQLLLAGEIDLLVEPDLPRAWLAGDATLARLFPEPEHDERAYYQATGVFPIMHPLVIRQEILARHPWVATSLYDAFARSRRLYTEHMQQPHRLSFAWPPVDAERRFFGRDPFAQGFAANRHDVAHMIQLAQDQGLLARPLGAEELFAPSTLAT